MSRRAMAVLALVLGLGVGPAAGAASWMCTVILCIGGSNPMQYADCRPPLRKFYRHLARGWSLPSCEGEDGGPILLRGGRVIYHDCPEGTVEMIDGPSDARRGAGFGRGRVVRSRWCAPEGELAQLCRVEPRRRFSRQHRKWKRRCVRSALETAPRREDQCYIELAGARPDGQPWPRHWYGREFRSRWCYRGGG